jgi:molybdate transport system substrate-binding protein
MLRRVLALLRRGAGTSGAPASSPAGGAASRRRGWRRDGAGPAAGTAAFLLAFSLNAEVRVFAAASLSDAVTELAAFYERRTRERVVLNFAASSVLGRQLELGARADLFLSADEARMDALQRRGLIDPRSRVSVLSNTLVVVGKNIRTPRDLVGKRVALAEPSSVPAGIYARQWLESQGLWKQISRNVIPTENVRAALSAVEAGNVDAAIVYKTDTRNYAFEVRDGPPISYPFAALKDSKSAARFLSFLRSPYARRVFLKHGFIAK